MERAERFAGPKSMFETTVEKMIPGIIAFCVGIVFLKNKNRIAKKMVQKTWKFSKDENTADVAFGETLLTVLSIGLIACGLVLLYRAGLTFFNT